MAELILFQGLLFESVLFKKNVNKLKFFVVLGANEHPDAHVHICKNFTGKIEKNIKLYLTDEIPQNIDDLRYAYNSDKFDKSFFKDIAKDIIDWANSYSEQIDDNTNQIYKINNWLYCKQEWIKKFGCPRMGYGTKDLKLPKNKSNKNSSNKDKNKSLPIYNLRHCDGKDLFDILPINDEFRGFWDINEPCLHFKLEVL